MLNIFYFHFNPFSVNTWVVWNEDKDTMIVDPGYCNAAERESLISFIDENELRPQAVVITHGHIDHVLGVADCCRRYGIRAYMSPEDGAVMPEHMKVAARFELDEGMKLFPYEPAVDGMTLHIAGTDWKVIATPGHSPGGVCYYSADERILFSGDTLFKGTIGRTDLPCCNYDDLIVSIMDKIMGLDGSTNVLPGHGTPTTIADERTRNPFLQPWGESDQEDLDWDADGIELSHS